MNEIIWDRLTDPQSGLSVLVITAGERCFYTFAKSDDPKDLTEPYQLPDDSHIVDPHLVNECAKQAHRSVFNKRVTYWIGREVLMARINELANDPIKVMQSVL